MIMASVLRAGLASLVMAAGLFGQVNQTGQWAPMVNWPFIPVSIAHMADGRIYAWASTRPTSFPAGDPYTYAAIYDPASGQITSLHNTAHDMFCAGLAQTGDGRVIASGGGADVRTTSTIGMIPRWSQNWTRLGDMLSGRWYNSSIALPSGNLLTMWGRSGGTLTETFNQTSNTWSAMSGIAIPATNDPPDNVDDDHQWFPHLHHMPNGRILMAGPLLTMRWIDYAGQGSWVDIGTRTPDGTRHRKLGASVQYLPGKILMTGGRDDRYQPSVWNTAVVIDTTTGTPVTTATQPMNYARVFHNHVLLPSGEVLAIGGNTSGIKFSDAGGVTVPEIWNPGTGTWRTLPAMATARGYHLVSLLLRDGRVLVGGGGLCACVADHPNTQIYTPGYLFNADGTAATRPVIDLVSPDWKAGITAGLKGSDNITGFRLIRLQATTHGINSDQRYIPLTYTKVGTGSYNLTVESNENVLIPGMYWLFAVTASGTPSIGYPIQVFTPATWPGSGTGDSNLAKGKPTTQSSTELNGAASRAVDGNTDGDFYKNSVSRTAQQAQPWWDVDLGANALLSQVKLWKRTDCCGDALANFHVFVSSQPFTGTTVAQTQAQAGVLDLAYPGTAPVTASLPVNAVGRYVRVQLEGTNSLDLAEVEVIGQVLTNSAPAVSLTAPVNGTSFVAPATIAFAATATDAENNLARVEFYQGTTKLGEALTAPYTYSWSNVAAGVYTVKARAVDTAGLSAEATATVTVNPPVAQNRAPVVSILSPVSGVTMAAPAAVTVEVQASDPDGNLVRVELYQGAVKLDELTAAPFLFNVNNVGAGTYTYTVRATDALGLTASATVTVRVLTRQLQSLKGVAVPEPAQLMSYVKNRSAAIALGKALFWDTQVSSDGQVACASCHFQAGADPRVKHQMNPGTFRTGTPAMTFDVSRTGTANGPNYVVKPGDFPRHVLSNPLDANSGVVYQSKDVMGSHGVLLRNFVSAEAGAAADACVSTSDPVFGAFRRVTGRNSPTVVNAVFNVRNFWDGRANAVFNGVDAFGPRNGAAVIYRGASATATTVALDNASLASQAVAAPLNTGEMSCAGRTWPEIGKRLLAASALKQQAVPGTDSVLGAYAAGGGVKGLTQTYETMVRAAFLDDLHTSAVAVSIGGRSYRQIEANFSLFFGLAVQMYEATLVSDQAPIDSYFANYPSTEVSNAAAMTAEQVAGMNVFNGKGRCVSCHHGPQLTNAGTPSREAAAIGALISRMRMGNGEAGAYDLGFYNLGVRGTSEDLGAGGTDPFGNPLSYARQGKSGVLKDSISVDACTFEIDACVALNSSSRDVVDGAFKTPTLRNVSLTGPYFHNGSAATLEEVVEFYDRGGNATGTTSANSTGYGANATNAHADIRPLALTVAEKSALVAFLKTALLDDRVVYERAPFDHPELPLVNGHSGTESEFVLLPAVGSGGRAQPVLPFAEILAAGGLGLPVVSAAPVVSLTAPVSGASFVAPAAVSLTASATTTQGTITKVEFFNGATLLGTSTAAPYGFNWANVAAGSYTLTAKATGSNGTTTTSAPVTISVTAAAAPVVSLTAPANGASFVAPAAVSLTASATTTQGTITKVEFFNGATLLGTSTAAPYGFSWANVAAGSYTLTAKATGSNGTTTTSAAVTVTVTAAAAPVVSLTAPVSGASFVAPAAVSLTASATTTQGTIIKVEFFNGATLLGTSTAAPYGFSWANVAAGSYTLTAKATGSNGTTTTSAAVTITVTAAAPVVTLTAPANGASFVAPAAVSLTASATTTQGTITKVEFFNGATLLGTSSAAPYGFSWANVAAGSYTLTAKATGSNGTTTTSAAVTVTVTAAAAAPVVSLTAPVNGASFVAPAAVSLTASATTTQGTITKVEFFNGATLLGTSTAAPYGFSPNFSQTNSKKPQNLA
jgi:cytochrome c peroxidase